MLRVAVFTKTPLGIKAKEAMDKGELVSDDLVVGIIDEAMKKPSRALSRIFMLALSVPSPQNLYLFIIVVFTHGPCI
ncbi:adenylate kinase 4-like [Hibiscus syriacus]|uniref:adenylate kinase 4-like n=1 Tax=Hibiscus syriacus TaxID=106335 RepID=UPI00192062EE|nr:adenylate kinase 4-like [Hibiscus syriacus]